MTPSTTLPRSAVHHLGNAHHVACIASAARAATRLETQPPNPVVRAPEGDAWRVDSSGLLELLGAPPSADDHDESFVVHRVARGSTVVHEGARADTIHVVQTGSFKCVKTAEDGYEHVLGFAWRRDVIGYDGLADGHYAFAAVALEDSRVVAVPFTRLAELRRRDAGFDAAVHRAVARQVVHAGEIAELMAAVAAEVRLARFLVHLSTRMAERGQSPRRLLLRMNRRDIANHIGVAHETISRSLRLLSDNGWLRVDHRDIEILDLAGLRRCARATRGVCDEVASHRSHEVMPCAA